MDDKTKQLVEEAWALVAYDNSGLNIDEFDKRFVTRARSIIPELRLAVKEQDKRARHAEAERDAFGERIRELEAQLREAVELAAEAVPYVSDYFRDKYEMNDRLAKLTSDSPSLRQTLESR